MGLTGGHGCVFSKEPLNSQEDGFADHYLVGEWHQLRVAEDQSFNPGEPVYSVEITDLGDLEIIAFGDDDAEYVYRGYSSQLGANKYINLWLMECRRCDEDDLAGTAPSSCPVLIVRYRTYLSESVISEIAAELESDPATVRERLDPYRGELLNLSYLSSEYFDNNLGDHNISVVDAGTDTCLASVDQNLRKLLSNPDPETFEDLLAIVVRRAPSSPVTKD